MEARALKFFWSIDFKTVPHSPHNGLHLQMALDDRRSYEFVWFLPPKKYRMRLDPSNPPHRTNCRYINVDGRIREADIA